MSLGVLVIQYYDKYLGMPSFISRDKKACFINMKERIWARMQGWKEKLLSQVGKEVMIKAVIQSIPAYSMSVFKLTTSLCKEIEMMIRWFWCKKDSLGEMEFFMFLKINRGDGLQGFSKF